MIYLPKHRFPKESFLYQYMEACETMETAREYDFWCGVWALSTACGRDVKVARPHAPVWLNWYIILTAESGITRKSTALNTAKNVLQSAFPEDEALWVENFTTTSKLLEQMQEHSAEHGHTKTTIHVSELVRFLGKASGATGLPGLLTDLYDCPERQVFGGSLTTAATSIDKVYISFISASTPSWLVRSINPNVIEGGFTSRTMFITAKKRKHAIAWSNVSDQLNISKLGKLLRDTVQAMAECIPNGQLTLNDAALARFRAWYQRLEPPTDSFRESFFSRQDAHVLRLAAVLCINDRSMIIMRRHIDAAIKIMHEVRESSAELFGGTKAPTHILNGISKLRLVLLEAGLEGITKTAISMRLRGYITARDLQIVLNTMHDLDLVQQFEIKVKKGRPTTIWRATQSLANVGVLDQVVARLT
jgi:hypothetical protein